MVVPTSAAPPVLRELTLRNILSFGPNTEPLALNALNIFIGPNGSGKSNFIDAIAALRSCAASENNVREVVSSSGQVGEWIWKGRPKSPGEINAVIENPAGAKPLRHVFAFRNVGHAFKLDDERIENETPNAGQRDAYFYYRFQQGDPVLNVQDVARHLERENVQLDVSILAQRRDPETYPEVSYLADLYSRVRIYREWQFGRNTVFRLPQRADLRADRLMEDFSNLGLVLSRMRRTPRVRHEMVERLQDLYEGVDDFDVSIEGGSVQVFFTEGDFPFPATRLSDGTLRYLCLLAILCDPEPPPLICIEEPELGLHPDVLPKLADLMVDASQRTQLIVTTHSDIMVDAMTERPESVVVCEKHGGQTSMKRLDRQELATWLEKYRLGELWTRGELGGTRW